MDPVDFAIYRYLSPGGEARFWGGRRVLDPRITPREIAERVGLSENGVRTRLRRLASRGYLEDRVVIPNPSLFGSQVYVVDLPVRAPGEVDPLLQDLELVDGVMFTRDVMDEDERKVRVHLVAETPASAARQVALLARLSASDRPMKPEPYYVPASDRPLSLLDWRVLNAVVAGPDASFAELAQELEVSVKSAARSYHRLIDSRGCWWTHGPGSEEFPLAFVRADLKSPNDLAGVRAWIGKEAPPWMPVAPDGFGLPPGHAEPVLAGLVPADAPTVLERFLRKFAGLDGVRRLRRTFPLGSATYTNWFRDRLTAAVSPGSRR